MTIGQEMDQIKEKLSTDLKKWQEIVGCGAWMIHTTYHYTINIDNPKTVGQANPNWEYIEAHIQFWLPELIGKTDTELTEIVVHELLHCTLSEMRQMAGPEWNELPVRELEHRKKHEERVVTILTRSFMNLERANDPTPS